MDDPRPLRRDDRAVARTIGIVGLVAMAAALLVILFLLFGLNWAFEHRVLR